MGNDVVIVKNGLRICGSGASLANVPIIQDKAYFEIKLQQEGIWGVGLATKNINLSSLPLSIEKEQKDENFCVFTNEAEIYQGNELMFRCNNLKLEVGTIIGITYDHVECKFYINNEPIEKTFSGLKGELYPIVYVDKGAILDVAFKNFEYEQPFSFDRILIEKSLL